MSEEDEKIARDAASQSLIVAASKVNESLGSFSGWLVAGVGAAFSLLLANFETVTRFICISNVRNALVLLVIGLVVAVLARLLAAMVSSALGSYEAGSTLGKNLQESGKQLDVNIYISEFERGLFPYQRWVARRTMMKVKAGDTVATARMIAKMSQVQALLVLAETLISIIAACFLVAGLKVL